MRLEILPVKIFILNLDHFFFLLHEHNLLFGYLKNKFMGKLIKISPLRRRFWGDFMKEGK